MDWILRGDVPYWKLVCKIPQPLDLVPSAAYTAGTELLVKTIEFQYPDPPDLVTVILLPDVPDKMNVPSTRMDFPGAIEIVTPADTVTLAPDIIIVLLDIVFALDHVVVVVIISLLVTEEVGAEGFVISVLVITGDTAIKLMVASSIKSLTLPRTDPTATAK